MVLEVRLADDGEGDAGIADGMGHVNALGFEGGVMLPAAGCVGVNGVGGGDAARRTP